MNKFTKLVALVTTCFSLTACVEKEDLFIKGLQEGYGTQNAKETELFLNLTAPFTDKFHQHNFIKEGEFWYLAKVGCVNGNNKRNSLKLVRKVNRFEENAKWSSVDEPLYLENLTNDDIKAAKFVLDIYNGYGDRNGDERVSYNTINFKEFKDLSNNIKEQHKTICETRYADHIELLKRYAKDKVLLERLSVHIKVKEEDPRWIELANDRQRADAEYAQKLKELEEKYAKLYEAPQKIIDQLTEEIGLYHDDFESIRVKRFIEAGLNPGDTPRVIIDKFNEEKAFLDRNRYNKLEGKPLETLESIVVETKTQQEPIVSNEVTKVKDEVQKVTETTETKPTNVTSKWSVGKNGSLPYNVLTNENGDKLFITCVKGQDWMAWGSEQNIFWAYQPKGGKVSTDFNNVEFFNGDVPTLPSHGTDEEVVISSLYDWVKRGVNVNGMKFVSKAKPKCINEFPQPEPDDM